MSRSEALERPWLPIGWGNGVRWPPPTRRQRTATGTVTGEDTGPHPAERKPLSPALVHAWTRTLMVSIGERPEQFGTHSYMYRIGGSTTLFAAGADATGIRTMDRWSSDIYRLYVRACFSQTIAWSRKAGSTVVQDVAQEYDEVDCY
jgi:hypothetical protein